MDEVPIKTVPAPILLWGVQRAAALTTPENFKEMHGVVCRLPLELQALYASLVAAKGETK
jgi:hypothetical protein